MTAYLTWTSAPGLMSSYKRIGPTHVYDSNGTLRATKTASAANLWVKELAGTDRNQVDLRFSVQASNPFCGGSIAGAFTLTVYRGGSWVLRSGQHKQMPNWEIYIRGYSTSAWRTIYRRSYYSSYCLSRWMCSEANMTATSGTY